MTDFFEIDFLDVETDKSGDAIAIRYAIDGVAGIHVVDGGFQASGPSVVSHVQKHYAATTVDHVVLTHPDGDHAGGLSAVLDEFEVGALWMHRPWLYAAEIIHRFETYSSVPHLESRLRKAYPTVAALEAQAIAKGIPIYEPFQGTSIGPFLVLAPSRDRYLDLLVESDKTPEHTDPQGAVEAIFETLVKAAAKVANLVAAAWGHEVFSTEETSNENEMSVVQFGVLCDKRVLLTGDAGRGSLTEAANFVEAIGLSLPGIDRFQVPHHGSRRNVSTEVLNRWLGPILTSQPSSGQELFTAICSSAKADEHHPRKSVVRALMHRGAKFITTEGRSIRTGHNAPNREGWGPVSGSDYPSEQEA